MDRKYCVYRHTSPNGKIYIGMTSIDPKKRWSNGRGYAGNEYFKRAIDKYGWDNFKHDVLCEGMTSEEAQQLEQDLIALYRSNEKEYGYNLTSGGEKGKRHTQEARDKMSMAKRGKYAGELNPRWGARLSEETRHKISEAHKGKFAGEKNPNYGKPMSDAQKALISKARNGKHYPKLSESMRNSRTCQEVHDRQKKPIAQYTRDGEYVQTWSGAPDASLFLLGHKRGQSNICSCANGSLPAAYGFIWKYVDKTTNNTLEVTA